MTYQQDVGIVKVKSMLSGEKCDILTYLYTLIKISDLSLKQ